MPTVSYEHLYGLAVAIYEAAGASTETAQTVARHQVGANLAGHDSHGIQLLPTYIQRSIAAISSPGWIP
jgi:LDH2 family malate/lactate/ureidoglycolate dehydrogenase